MGQEQAKQLLQRGIAAARSGQPDIARDALQQSIRLDPHNEMAWLWLSSVARDDSERLFCLKQLLAINPQNEFALKGLRALGVEPVHTTEPGAGASVPVLDDTKYARVQQSVDDLLRRYNPQPVDHLNIPWTHKRRKRYGEGGATRLRQALYAVAALVLIGFAAVVVLAISQVDFLDRLRGEEVGVVYTRVPSLTPTLTMTPTIGGPTPTPFPGTMAVPATSVPAGLEQRGNPYGLASPTALYPRVNVNVARLVEEAVNYYSIGDYDEAIRLLSTEREQSDHCYPSVVYYEALSHAAEGDYRQALDLLNEARAYEPPRGFTSCQGEPLILAGLAQVSFMQNPQSQDALTFSDQALSADPRLIQAVVTKARAQLVRGQVTAALSTVTQALLESPEDTNLLILAAEIQLANNQLRIALDYIGQALYIEPALQPALHLQAETYLRLAGQSPAGSQEQVQYYGLAVLSAQTLLQYYAGDPAGYLYLAQARLGEGNDDLAEEALTRIIDVRANLPESAQSIILDAFRLRGDLYFRQGRFESAKDDLERVAYTGSGALNSDVAATLADIAFKIEDYAEANIWLSQLLSADRSNREYQLLQAKTLVELCTFYPDQLTCEYDTILSALSDAFVASLTALDQRADAYSYRAQARYWTTVRRGVSLAQSERQSALQQALADVALALAVRQTAVDHYVRGLILEELGDIVPAYEEYQWVVYWSDLYPYPFTTSEFDRRFAALADRVQQLTELAIATPTPTPTATPGGGAVPSPTRTQTPPGPRATATPTSTPAPVGVTPVPIP